MSRAVVSLRYVAPAFLIASQVLAQSCCEPTGVDFPKVGGNYGNQSYSSLAKINRSNIARLGGAWHDSLEGGSTEQFQQASFVAIGGVLYIETTQGKVFAVDGKSGKIKWTYNPDYGTQIHRGVAVGEGKVFATMALR
jgi:glucose dehydrogenase